MKKILILLLALFVFIPVIALTACGDECEHTWSDATCASPKTCSKCQLTDGGAVGHKYSKVSETDASCAAVGKEEFKCEYCADVKTSDIPKLAHTYGEWDTTTEADCENTGKRKRTCEKCDYVDTETIPAKGHTVDEYTTEDATCTEDGSKKGTCTVCSELVTEVIDAKGHELEKVDAKAATETEDGNIEHWKCTACDKCYDSDEDDAEELTAEEILIPATGQASA